MAAVEKDETRGSIALGKVSADTGVVVRSLSGDKQFISKAISMGIIPGSGLVIVRNHKIGPVIIFLRDSFIAIGRREAGNILVEV